jgi:flagellar biosynthesis protein FliQ
MFFKAIHHMTSKQTSVGIGIPMIVVGALLAVLLAPTQIQLKDTIEFIGSLIGILGVLIFIAGLFMRKTPQISS